MMKIIKKLCGKCMKLREVKTTPVYDDKHDVKGYTYHCLGCGKYIGYEKNLE